MNSRFVKIFTAIRTRPLAVLLLCYQFCFFNLIVPGHTRGSITLDGKHTPDTVACCCCCCGKPAATRPDQKHAPSEHDKRECAICHLAARVLPVTPVSFIMPEVGLVALLPVAQPAIPVAADQVTFSQPRAPPVAHA